MKTRLFRACNYFLSCFADLLQSAINPAYTGLDQLPGTYLTHAVFVSDLLGRPFCTVVESNELANLCIALAQASHGSIHNPCELIGDGVGLAGRRRDASHHRPGGDTWLGTPISFTRQNPYCSSMYSVSPSRRRVVFWCSSAFLGS